MSEDLNRSSHTGDKLDGPLDVPEGSGTPLSPGWNMLFTLPTYVHFVGVLQVDSLEGSSRKC